MDYGSGNLHDIPLSNCKIYMTGTCCEQMHRTYPDKIRKIITIIKEKTDKIGEYDYIIKYLSSLVEPNDSTNEDDAKDYVKIPDPKSDTVNDEKTEK